MSEASTQSNLMHFVKLVSDYASVLKEKDAPERYAQYLKEKYAAYEHKMQQNLLNLVNVIEKFNESVEENDVNGMKKGMIEIQKAKEAYQKSKKDLADALWEKK